MKIYSFYNNYRSDATNLHPQEKSPSAEMSPALLSPEWMVLPDSVMLRSGKPLFLPGEDGYMIGLPSLCIKLNRLGKSIAPRFAYRYFNEIAPAVQFLPEVCLKKIAGGSVPKASETVFDGAVMIGDFISLPEAKNNDEIFPETYKSIFSSVDDSEKENVWNLDRLKLSFAEIIEIISKFNTVKMGDLVILGLNPYGFPAFRNRQLSLFIDNKKLLSFKLK